ncbi:LOW QUALITY PROTEIN: hypothetical protein MC885_017037, partial [Smutsia gigantea]
QKCGFRKAPKKAEPKRSDTGINGEAYKRGAWIPPVGETVFYPSPDPIRTLVKPFFMLGCAFGSAAIRQDKSLKSRVQSYSDGINTAWLDSIRPQKEVKKQWNELSDGQWAVAGIIAANVFVFRLWGVPSLQWTMISRYECFVELLLQHSEHSGSRAVHSSGLTCRRYFQFCQCVKLPQEDADCHLVCRAPSQLSLLPSALRSQRGLGTTFLPMPTLTAGNALKAAIAMMQQEGSWMETL